jgi:O-antigen ligase
MNTAPTSPSIWLAQAALVLLLLSYFFIPITPVGVNIAVFASLLLGLFSAPIRARYAELLKEKVFISCLLFYGLLMVSSLYGPGSLALKLHYLGKYLEIGYLPFLAAICFKDSYREKALHCFSAAMVLTLCLSYLLYFQIPFERVAFGWTPMGSVSNPSIFKLHITHNLFMAFAVFLWFQLAIKSGRATTKIIYFGLVLLGLFNVLAMVEGRTGYLTLLALLAVLIVDKLSIKKMMIALLITVVAAFAAYQWVPKVYSKVNLAISEVSEWAPNQGFTTNVGARLDFWHASYLMFKENPVFGLGIAGFEEGHKALLAGTGREPSNNPHNQYLLFLNQIGIVGLLAFLWLNWVVWKESYRLTPLWGVWVRAIVLGYGAANLVNALLIDSAEGSFFSTSLALAFAILLSKPKEGGRSLRHSAEVTGAANDTRQQPLKKQDNLEK